MDSPPPYHLAIPQQTDYDKRTPLHLAASEGHLDCVKLLLEYWANVNPIDRMGGTPLTDAVRHGHIHIQQVLRERGGVLNMVRASKCGLSFTLRTNMTPMVVDSTATRRPTPHLTTSTTNTNHPPK